MTGGFAEGMLLLWQEEVETSRRTPDGCRGRIGPPRLEIHINPSSSQVLGIGSSQRDEYQIPTLDQVGGVASGAF